MNRAIAGVVAALALLLLATGGNAQIHSANEQRVIFAPGKVPEGVTWSPRWSLTEAGLAVGSVEMLPSLWVQSGPVSVAFSWRLISAVSVKAWLEGSAQGNEAIRAYVRYGCDRHHWSTWQPLHGEAGSGRYVGDISVPEVARQRFESLSQEWSLTNPVWTSDDHELCLWVAQHYPDFFDTELPGVGYVQVRVEGIPPLGVTALGIGYSWASGGARAMRDQSDTRPMRSSVGAAWFFDTGKETMQK